MVLDELIHQPTRLRLMAALAALPPDTEAEFVFLRDLLGLTDGNLSTHLTRLEAAGYLDVRKTFVGRKPRTYVRLTPRGRLAFAEHRAALEQLLAGRSVSSTKPTDDDTQTPKDHRQDGGSR
ncbi:MAG: transcriptional regulator [Thermomicrobium sp.]|nr:transcriptional regulator [Thermomicrobium sp.]